MISIVFGLALVIIGALVWITVRTTDREIKKVRQDDEELNRAIQNQRRIENKLRTDDAYRDRVRKQFNDK